MKLANLTEDVFARLVRAAFDMAIVLDKEAVIAEVFVRKSELMPMDCQTWVGRSWLATMTGESRANAQEMLASHDAVDELPWRHIHHGTANGANLSMQYVVLSLGEDGRWLALGRNMADFAPSPQPSMDTPQSMARDHLCHVETKYRILFEAGQEAAVLVDGLSFRVLDANSSAQVFAKRNNSALLGLEITECFEPDAREEIQWLLRMSHASGRVEMCRARFIGADAGCSVSVSVLRQESGPYFLMRWLPHGMTVQPPSMADLQPLFSVALGHSPDGFVLTDKTGVIKAANEKWISMLGVADLSQLYGQPLENCLARGNVDWGVLLTILRSQTVVKDFAAELRGLTGSTIAVEISVRTLSTDQTYYAFYVRDMERIQTKESSIVAIGMENSVAGLSELVGRMPMHDIVGETVDMIEKKCIQTALELTRNNRASAAQMLGLSRQSLYVKLRRFGMISDVEVRGLTD